ncbi:MAG: zf-HC2 domain-containing protein [Acidobacteria bacterium]|nr:zf-HC2 domain-containing protein [Acidobacteriota bacterium]
MTCFSELTYTTYTDGELPPEEMRRVGAHLAGCSRCRVLVEALRAESRLLVAALEDKAEAPAPLVSARPRDILWTVLAVLGAAVGLDTALNWLREAQAATATEWLNPLGLAAQLGFFFNAFFYLLREEASMLLSNLTTFSILLLGLVVIGAGFYWFRRRPTALAVLVTLVLALALAQPGTALEPRKVHKGTLTIAAGEILDDTLVAFGQKVVVDGTVTGNVIVFGEGIEINGTVKGDLICFNGGVRLQGAVEGNVFCFSGGIDMPGRVGQSAYAFVGGFNLQPGSQVGGDLVAFAGGLNLMGTVKRDVAAFAGGTNIGGTVGRNVVAYTDKLTVMSSGRIGGNVRAHCDKPDAVRIDPGATIGGKVETKVAEPRGSRYSQPRFYFRKALGTAIAFVVGLFLYWLFPALFAQRLDTPTSLLRTAALGFLALVALPVAALIAAIILFGIGVLADVLLIALLFPLLVLVVWGIGLYIAKILVGVWLGHSLFRPQAGQPPQFAVPLLVGLILVVVAMSLPYLGVVIHFLVWLLGLGLAVPALRTFWERTRVQPSA